MTSYACERCGAPAERQGFCPACGGELLDLTRPEERAWVEALQERRFSARWRGPLALAAGLGIGLAFLMALGGLMRLPATDDITWLEKKILLSHPMCGLVTRVSYSRLSARDLCLRRATTVGLQQVELINLDMEGAAPVTLTMREVTLRGGTLRGAQLAGFHVRDQTWEGVDAAEVKLSRARLGDFTVRGGSLEGANLRKARGWLLWSGDEDAPLQAAGLNAVRADLPVSELEDVVLRGADLSEARLRQSTLTRVDLSGANLRDVNLAGATLRDVKLDGADLTGADLTEADLCGVDLSGVVGLQWATLDRVLASSETRFPGGQRPAGVILLGPGVDARGLALREIDASGAELRGVDLRGVNLDGARFMGADLRGALLQDAKLFNINLDGAQLEGAQLDAATLYRVSMRGADLRGVDLTGIHYKSERHGPIRVDLTGADLSGADLRGLDLNHLDLSAAKLDGADLRGASISASRLADLDLEGAIVDEGGLTIRDWTPKPHVPPLYRR